MRYIGFIVAIMLCLPNSAGSQHRKIDPSTQPTFKEPPLGNAVTATRSCISAPYTTRGGVLKKRAESVPLPYVPKEQRVAATVTGTALRPVVATVYDRTLRATADDVREAAAGLSEQRTRLEHALASLRMPGLTSFLHDVELRNSSRGVTAVAIMRIEIPGQPDEVTAARIAAAAGVQRLEPAHFLFGNAESAAEDMRAELEAAVRAKASEIAAERGRRLVELLDSQLRASVTNNLGIHHDRATVDVTASATFRSAPAEAVR